MNRAFAVMCIVSGLIGGVIGASVESQRRDGEARVTAAVHSVETAGLCANSLDALDQARPDKQRLILERRMESAIDYADRSLEGIRDPKIGIAIPNLIEGLRRARQYAEGQGNRDVVAKCDRVLAGLERGSRA